MDYLETYGYTTTPAPTAERMRQLLRGGPDAWPKGEPRSAHAFDAIENVGYLPPRIRELQASAGASNPATTQRASLAILDVVTEDDQSYKDHKVIMLRTVIILENL